MSQNISLVGSLENKDQAYWLESANDFDKTILAETNQTRTFCQKNFRDVYEAGYPWDVPRKSI